MNKQRRKMIQEGYDLLMQGKSLIDTALEEEQAAYDNLPEGIQSGSTGDEMQEFIDALQECSDGAEEAINAIGSLV